VAVNIVAGLGRRMGLKGPRRPKGEQIHRGFLTSEKCRSRRRKRDYVPEQRAGGGNQELRHDPKQPPVFAK